MSSTHGHAAPCGTAQSYAANQSAPWPHSSTDPTATKQLRARYAAEAYRRFRALKGAILTSVVERDGFGIGGRDGNSPGPGQNADDAAALAANLDLDVHEAEAMLAVQDAGINISPARPNGFAFPSDPDKADAFEDWLQEQVDRGILEVGRAKRNVAAGTPWQNTYIRQAYSRGVTHADAALADMGIIDDEERIQEVFNAPKHADGVAMVYSRAYNELQGVTDEMGQQISRELAAGLSQGENPRKIARRMNDRVEKIGITRARTVARTEVVRAHNEGGLNRYQSVESRLDGVEVLAEWSTAQDSDVCPICMSFESQTFDLKESRGRIPAHPNCRCVWLPVRKQDRGDE